MYLNILTSSRGRLSRKGGFKHILHITGILKSNFGKYMLRPHWQYMTYKKQIDKIIKQPRKRGCYPPVDRKEAKKTKENIFLKNLPPPAKPSSVQKKLVIPPPHWKIPSELPPPPTEDSPTSKIKHPQIMYKIGTSEC